MSANKIISGLWLGDLKSGQNRKFLHTQNITCDVHAQRSKECDNDEHKFLHIPVFDTNNSNIHQYFVKTVKFIHAARKNNENVLVHCRAGISSPLTSAITQLFNPLDQHEAPSPTPFNIIRENPGQGIVLHHQHVESPTVVSGLYVRIQEIPLIHEFLHTMTSGQFDRMKI